MTRPWRLEIKLSSSGWKCFGTYTTKARAKAAIRRARAWYWGVEAVRIRERW